MQQRFQLLPACACEYRLRCFRTPGSHLYGCHTALIESYDGIPDGLVITTQKFSDPMYPIPSGA
mgnify:CR=1 FL=1